MSPSSAPPPVLEMIDLVVGSLYSPDSPQIEVANWMVFPGQFWVVGGLPGSGKSDLLATAAGLLPPIRGCQRIFNQEPSHLQEQELIHQRLRIGIVFANEGRLFQNLTVAENLALPLRYHRNSSAAAASDRVNEVLQTTGLTEFAHRRPATINPNLRERVALARALTLFPEVLMLDNPLRGLDPGQLRWWQESLLSLSTGAPILQKKPITLVIATDNFRPLLDYGTHFALIENQKWQFLGTRKEMQNEHRVFPHELLAD